MRCRAHARSLTPNTRSHSPPALLVYTDIFCFAPADLHSSFLSEASCLTSFIVPFITISNKISGTQYWSLMYLQTPRVAWQRNYCLAGLTCAPHTPHILLCHSRLLIQSWKYPIFKLLLLRLKKKKKIWFTSFKEALVATFYCSSLPLPITEKNSFK